MRGHSRPLMLSKRGPCPLCFAPQGRSPLRGKTFTPGREACFACEAKQATTQGVNPLGAIYRAVAFQDRPVRAYPYVAKQGGCGGSVLPPLTVI